MFMRTRDIDLPTGGVMLSAPEFVVPQPFEMFHELQVALYLQRWVLADWMVWCEERTETQICQVLSLEFVDIDETQLSLSSAHRSGVPPASTL